MDRTEAVRTSVEALLASSEFEVVDVECAGGTRGFTVRVYVDREGGVSIEDCARLSRALGDQFEVDGLLTGHYVLEVSSPGIDRPVRKAADFARFTGETIEITTFEKIDGRHHYVGRLSGYEEAGDRILLTDERGETVVLPRAAVKRANLRRDPWAGTRGTRKRD